MTEEQTNNHQRRKVRKPLDDVVKPLPIEEIVGPEEELQKTSASREWQIKRLQEQLGVSRDIAEKMVDEKRGSS